MHDNKVSEKAIWEGAITPDNDTPSMGSQAQVQPQMMFCYKCNNVIPGNSNYCPYCQVKLYTECPKCGVKYSSQYPACNQCGTNREEYLRAQRREQERKEAIERENRRRQEILEKEKREREQQEALKRQQHEAYRRQQYAAYERLKEQIMNTKEYQSTYSILKEALESWRRKHIMIIVLSIVLAAFIMITYKSLGDGEPDGAFAIILYLVLPWGLTMGILVPLFRLFNTEKREKYVMQYISKNGSYYDKYILTYVVKQMGNDFYKSTYDVLDNLSQWCIEAYKKQK
jgi:hypothetical protein